jgi:hypothetical protein
MDDSQGYSFLRIDKAATIRNAIPAHQKSPVRNQTMNATTAAGIKTRSIRMTKIIAKPIMTKPINPNKG